MVRMILIGAVVWAAAFAYCGYGGDSNLIATPPGMVESARISVSVNL